MRIVFWKSATLVMVLVGSVLAQAHDSVSVAFVIDGRPARCNPFGVDLRLDGKIIKPKLTDQTFDVPDVFKKHSQWPDNQYVDISLSCGEYSFSFPGRHPAFVRAGEWELGIARPLYAIERFSRTEELEQGGWLAYLIFEGEPGVVTFAPQPDAPVDIANAMQKEQPNASGKRARDLAYSLAVFRIEYQTNRDYLMRLLNSCLSRPRESPENDECDGKLLAFVTNLYWRGDNTLLVPLLQMADSRRDVIGEIGTFYSDLLDRQKGTALAAIKELGADQQHLVCRLAYKDDLSNNRPKRDRIKAFLSKTGGDAAARCSSAIEE
jgi:hypothetical protein